MRKASRSARRRGRTRAMRLTSNSPTDVSAPWWRPAAHPSRRRRRRRRGKEVRGGAGQNAGDALDIEFADGRLGAVVAPGGAPKPQAKKAAAGKGNGKQGTLL